MKRVKEKLRKLTLFDRIIILIAISFVIFFGYAFFRKASYVTVTVKVGEENIYYQAWRSEAGSRVWFAELFHKGMKETDGLGRIGAEVVSVYSYNSAINTKAVYLTVNLRAVYNRATNQYTFKGFPLSIGSQVRLNLDNLFVDGLVTHVDGVEDPRKKVKLLVETKIVEESSVYPETSGTSESIANGINVDDQVKDSQGNTIIKIVKKRVENAKRLVTNSSGEFMVRNHPLRYDVYLTLEVEAIDLSGSYFLFDDVPILIGEEIPVFTPFISVLPEVTHITLLD